MTCVGAASDGEVEVVAVFALPVQDRLVGRPWTSGPRGLDPLGVRASVPAVRTSSRCQRSSVAGVTRNADHRSLDNSLANITSASRSEGVLLGRATCRRNTISLVPEDGDLHIPRVQHRTEPDQTEPRRSSKNQRRRSPAKMMPDQRPGSSATLSLHPSRYGGCSGEPPARTSGCRGSEHRWSTGPVSWRGRWVVITVTSGLHGAPVSASEHRSSTGTSTVDGQTILPTAFTQVRDLFRVRRQGLEPRTRGLRIAKGECRIGFSDVGFLMLFLPVNDESACRHVSAHADAYVAASSTVRAPRRRLVLGPMTRWGSAAYRWTSGFRSAGGSVARVLCR